MSVLFPEIFFFLENLQQQLPHANFYVCEGVPEAFKCNHVHLLREVPGVRAGRVPRQLRGSAKYERCHLPQE